MPRHLQAAVARALLLVMVLTFFSPTLGWQMMASHHELEHAMLAHDSHHGEDDHHDAHGFVGHLLTHMPMSISAMFSAPPAVTGTPGISSHPVLVSSGVPEALFHPPRSPLFV